MITKIDICNMALAHLGQETISSLEQDNELARRCRLFYEPVKQEVLRTHNWAFACGVAPLALLDTLDQASSKSYVYAYPQDCLFIRKVCSADQKPQAFEESYRQDVQARVITCQIPQAQAVYTRNVSDESIFDPAFAKAFSLALAADMAVSLTADTVLAQRINQKYQLALEEARRSNMTENFERPATESAFVECR